MTAVNFSKSRLGPARHSTSSSFLVTPKWTRFRPRWWQQTPHPRILSRIPLQLRCRQRRPPALPVLFPRRHPPLPQEHMGSSKICPRTLLAPSSGPISSPQPGSRRTRWSPAPTGQACQSVHSCSRIQGSRYGRASLRRHAEMALLFSSARTATARLTDGIGLWNIRGPNGGTNPLPARTTDGMRLALLSEISFFC